MSGISCEVGSVMVTQRLGLAPEPMFTPFLPCCSRLWELVTFYAFPRSLPHARDPSLQATDQE